MSTLFFVTGFLCLVAVPILMIIFIIRWILKKPKKPVGIAAICCFGAVIVLMTVGSQIRLAEMTLEEREAYNAKVYATDAAVATSKPTPESTIAPTPTPESTIAPTPTPEPTIAPTPTPTPIAAPTP